MKRLRWLGFILAVLVVGGGVGGYVLYRKVTAATSSVAAESVETAVVSRGSLRATVEGSGSVTALNTLNLAFGTGGTVAEVLVQAGEQVQAGQPLARLDTADLLAAVQQAEIARLQAQLQLSQTLAGPDATELAAAEAALANAKASYAELTGGPTAAELKQAEVALEQARINLEAAQAAYDRAGGSWRAEVDYSPIASSLWEAQAAYETALASYEAVKQGATTPERQAAWAKVQQAQATLDRLKAQPAQAEIRLAELNVARAEAALKLAQYNLAQATLVAPWAGTVTAVNLAPGDTAGGVAMVLSDLPQLAVEIQLDEADVVQVAEGQPAQVTLEAFAAVVLTGTVAFIAPTATLNNGVALYPVLVTFPASSTPVRLGMTANVSIITAEATDALWIPVSAVQWLGERSFVLRRLRAGETLTETLPLRQGGFPQGASPGAGLGSGSGAAGEQPAGSWRQNGAAGARPAFRAGQVGGQWAGFVLTPVQVGAQTDTQAVITEGLQEGDVVAVSTLTAWQQQTGVQPRLPGGEPLPAGAPPMAPP